MNEAVRVNFKLKPKQAYTMSIMKDYNDPRNKILFGGAAGGGKTYLGCSFLVSECLEFDGINNLIGRRTLKDLTGTTYRSLRMVMRDMGLVEGYHFKVNFDGNVLNYVRFFNDSQIVAKDVAFKPSDPEYQRLGSLELTHAFIDEGGESGITEEATDIISVRIGRNFGIDNKYEHLIKPILLIASNPSKNFLREIFYQRAKEGVLPEYMAFIPSNYKDNDSLSKQYLTQLDRLPKERRDRLMEGLWSFLDDPYQLIGSLHLELKTRPYDDESKFKISQISVDPSGEGSDETIFALGNEMNIERFMTMSDFIFADYGYAPVKKDDDLGDMEIVADCLVWLIKKYGVLADKIIIDAIYGSLWDIMKRRGYLCLKYKSSYEPFLDFETETEFINLRAQSHWWLKTIIEDKEFEISVPNNSKMKTDLTAVHYDDSTGKIKIEKKDKIKELIGRSPDRGDAVVMYFSIPVFRKRTHGIGIIKVGA